jgi:hypothetical protein
MRNSGRRAAPTRTLFALIAAGIVVAGCTTIESVTGPISSVFAPASTDPTAPPGTPTGDIECPQVTVRSGAATWQIPPGTNATGIRYQATLGQLARECAVVGDTMTVKVGVEGRVLVGPKGGPGSVTVPLRIAVVHEGPQPRSLWTKFYSVPVTIAAGTTQAAFAQVEDDVTFVMPANRRDLEQYIVYVGFDPQGLVPAARQKQKTTTAKAKPKPKPKQTPPATTTFQQPQQPAPPPGTFAPPPPPPPTGPKPGAQ